MTVIPARVLDRIGEAIGGVAQESVRPVGGGSINRAYRVCGANGKPYFLKINEAGGLEMFEAERDGLRELKNAGAVRVPEPVACGLADRAAFLLLEHLELSGRSSGAAATLGKQLAAQHRHTAAAFGWSRDNTIGSTPQPNEWDKDWVAFLGSKRLGFQLGLAARNGYGGRLQKSGEALMTALPILFTDYLPEPSLLHGDLWGGNWGAMSNGEPVIFDPAVYYGDREADIAMTMLFGGFGSEFYQAYEVAWPLDAGFAMRRDLYNLYHVLNHLNLFGGAYQQQAVEIIDTLVAQIG